MEQNSAVKTVLITFIILLILTIAGGGGLLALALLAFVMLLVLGAFIGIQDFLTNVISHFRQPKIVMMPPPETTIKTEITGSLYEPIDENADLIHDPRNKVEIERYTKL